jgi:DNA-binding MarR family transcriptional regulator
MPDPMIGVHLFEAYRELEKRAYDAVVTAGYHDITVAQARIAARIGPEGTRLSELAEQARVTKQTAGHLVDQLERSGYVERVPDPTDGRARLVRLTPLAEQLVPIANAEVSRALGEWEARLGPRRMREFADSLAVLQDP